VGEGSLRDMAYPPTRGELWQNSSRDPAPEDLDGLFERLETMVAEHHEKQSRGRSVRRVPLSQDFKCGEM